MSADISERVASLSDTHRECMAQIARLSRTSGIGTEDARKELAGLIHHTLKDAERELELLSIEISDLNPTLDPQAALTSKLHKLSEDIKLARIQYRKAQIIAKNESEKARRQMLFGDATEGSIEGGAGGGGGARRRAGGRGRENKKDLTGEELVESASNDVTLALRRTHEIMSAELSRSQFAAETLALSTQTIKNLSSTYTSFDSVLIASRALITDLVRKNKSDQWYYQMSLYCLVSTIIWLIFRRFLWGPLYLLVWLPFKMLFRALGFAVSTGSSLSSSSGKGGDEAEDVVHGEGGGRLKNEAASIASKLRPEKSVVVDDVTGEQATVEAVKIKMSSGEEVEVPIQPVKVPPPTEGEYSESEGEEGRDAEAKVEAEVEAEAPRERHDEL